MPYGALRARAPERAMPGGVVEAASAAFDGCGTLSRIFLRNSNSSGVTSTGVRGGTAGAPCEELAVGGVGFGEAL